MSRTKTKAKRKLHLKSVKLKRRKLRRREAARTQGKSD